MKTFFLIIAVITATVTINADTFNGVTARQVTNIVNGIGGSALLSSTNQPVLDISKQTGLSGYNAINNGRASYIGQIGMADFGAENKLFCVARSTTIGDWYVFGGTSGGSMVIGNYFRMAANASGSHHYITMGNPALQNIAQVSVDAQNVSIDVCPFNSGPGWICALTSTNSHSGTWTSISTNTDGQIIYQGPDTFVSYMAVNEQAPEYDLPGYGLIVQNGNDQFAQAQSISVGGVTGNYSYWMTHPSTHEVYYPVWLTNAWNSSSNNFIATKLDTYTGSWNFISNVTAQGILKMGSNTVQVTFGSGFLNPSAFTKTNALSIDNAQIMGTNFMANLTGSGNYGFQFPDGGGMGERSGDLTFGLSGTEKLLLDASFLRLVGSLSLFWGTDGGGDIGASGASRPNNVFVKLLTTSSGGFASLKNNLAAPTSITFPATTVNWTNSNAFNIQVYIDNAAVTGTAIKKNGTTIFTSVTGDATFGLQPGEYFSETYTVGTPTATWSAF